MISKQKMIVAHYKKILNLQIYPVLITVRIIIHQLKKNLKIQFLDLNNPHFQKYYNNVKKIILLYKNINNNNNNNNKINNLKT